jgi:hypothetical protein
MQSRLRRSTQTVGVMKGHLIILGALSLAYGNTLSQSGAATPDPDIVVIVTGGSWEHDGKRGTFRIVVRNCGFEHVSSQVTADWITEPRSLGYLPKIETTRQLLAAGAISVGMPELESIEDAMRVTIRGTPSVTSSHIVTCVYDLKADGTVVVAMECSQ